MADTLSPLHASHVALGATMVPFAGWTMPVRYTSDIAEHQAVRSNAGLFDLSHMGEIVVRGDEAEQALDYAVVGRMSAVAVGAAKYTMMCTPEGGVIDDLIVYRRDWDHFLIVANASNSAVVVAELTARVAGFQATVTDESQHIALIAVQGPAAQDIVAAMCDRGADDVVAQRYYSSVNVVLRGDVHAMVARTGYTGEDGFELFVTADSATAVWDLAREIGGTSLVPCGLAARDTLRLEAGMPLYGQELSRDMTPYEAGLGRVVALGTAARPRGDFVGHDALVRAKSAGAARQLVGLVGTGRRAARMGYAVLDGESRPVGVVTSGAPSPTLGKQIAMAYVPPALAVPGTVLGVDVRGRREDMTVTPLPFYARGS